MKKLIIILGIIISSQVADAQLQFGIVGSYNMSIGKSESTLIGTPEGRKAMEVGFLEHRNLTSFGISLRKDFGYLFFDGQLQYRKNAYTMRVQNFLQIDAPMNYIEETSSVIHIPIVGGLKFKNLRIGGGPIFNFQTNQSANSFDIYNIEENKRQLQMGFLGHIGIDISSQLSLNLRYEHSFSKVGDDYKYGGKLLPINSKLDYLSVGFGIYLW